MSEDFVLYARKTAVKSENAHAGLIVSTMYVDAQKQSCCLKSKEYDFREYYIIHYSRKRY
jgi:hypothetical protein